MTTVLNAVWKRLYQCVPAQLARVREVGRAATAFNTNIDAVIKLSGKQLTELVQKVGLKNADLEKDETFLNSPIDVVRGIIKCFCNGIAEEWLCEDKKVYEWLQLNLGYDRLQMGGQAGIIANVLAVLGATEVCAHTNSLPRLQAQQFLDADNLVAADKDGTVHKARDMDCRNDAPLVHWIIEFDAGDSFQLGDKTYTCPKSNRFIATYDTANIELQINDGFVQYLDKVGFDYLILSGYHNLTAERGGAARIAATVPMIEHWKRAFPNGIIHLELASTQDKKVRQEIIEQLAPRVHSVGLNEREALDALEVVDSQKFAEVTGQKLTAPRLFEILRILKAKFKTPRVQLHFLGIYLTLQDSGLRITPEQNLRGMMLAATVAASKAGLGSIEKAENLLWAKDMPIGAASLENVRQLAEYLQKPQLAECGMATINGLDLIAVPTIVVEKPKTLVGMGDTISSISLVGAR